jgi:cyclophilin family peptidyl-prolyl cis-trans isomerase
MAAAAMTAAEMAAKKYFLISTKLGPIAIRFRDDAAPKSCQKMRQLISNHYYTGCCFYRAEPNFVVQGGLKDAATGKALVFIFIFTLSSLF